MDRKRLLRNPLLWIISAFLLIYAFSVLFDTTRGYHEVTTSQALAQIDQGKVNEATIEDKEQRIRLTLNAPDPAFGNSTNLIAQYPAGATDTVVGYIRNAHVPQWN